MATKAILLTLCLAFFAVNAIESAVVPKYRYLAVLQPSTFFEAWQDCSSEGGHLASIESRQEQALVEEAMSKARNEKAVFYIGGTDIGRKGRWVWIGLNKVLVDESYRNFYPGEPNNLAGHQDCLSIGNWHGYSRGKWDDTECFTKLDGYICAFRA
uniref:C-type lectin domain-containing protein n=1 Tax=Anopheles christyi TaxID=43041 RepID=A0A182KA07_9DIPT